MRLSVLLAATFLATQADANVFRSLYKDTGRFLSSSVGDDVGEPLILTPYLEEGKIEEAQKAAKVEHSSFGNIESYAGYFTVDAAYGSNIWFWFFPSADNITEDPVVLWLNGGPGASSLNGLFIENGPFIVNENGSVSFREYSWHLNHSVIFIDQPVGTGFSFTTDGLAKNETKVGDDMYSALTQFFQLFPNLQNNSFYISGESYAGKYLPAIGYTILKKNPVAEVKLNLQGILIGDGWTDPEHQVDYGPFLYNTGLISAAVKVQIDEQKDLAVAAIQDAQWSEAQKHINTIYSLTDEVSETNIYNYIEDYDDSAEWAELLTTTEYRAAIHVGSTLYGDKGAGEALEEDVPKSVVPWVEELLENYPVLVFTGQLDIICGYPMVLDYLKTLNFTGADEFSKSTRKIWHVDDEAAGYVRTGGNLVELMVRNAGHMVPRDQPKWGYDLVYRFTRGKPFA
ncbi:vitellogenic carboxypeptidase-like [Euwallacea fornicatus]|uniref:vitellogenic carboxypeptidase-like n=1 Tax=Euwallacea fornicatus TaxID=995702 RepID=UPI00338F6128